MTTTLTITQTGPGTWDLYSVVKTLLTATGGADTSSTGTGTEITWDLPAIPGASDIVADGTGLVLTAGAITAGTVTSLQIALVNGGSLTLTGFSLNVATAKTYASGNYPITSFVTYNDAFSARDLLPGKDAHGNPLFDGVSFAGGTGNDTMLGSNFDDTLGGSSGNDSINGYDGNDWLVVGIGINTFDGGKGTGDVIDFSGTVKPVGLHLNGSTAAPITIDGHAAGTAVNIETIIGGSKDDKLTGDSNANVLLGLAGKDSLDGGGGVDTANYSNTTKAVAVTLNGSTWVDVKIAGVAEDKLRNIEDLIGGSKSDALTGDSKNNYLAGQAGNDTLSGGTGNDVLAGATGKDQLRGGSGSDEFIFREHVGSANADVIMDYSHGHDVIALDSGIFHGLGTPGHRVGPTHFFVASGPQHAGQAALIYSPTSGRLYYDDDGKGGHDIELVLTFSHKPSYLDSNDFYLL